MADRAIVDKSIAAVPKDYKVASAQTLRLKAVRAIVDGSGAGSAFYPVLQIVAPDGTVMWESKPATTVAAGASADVSWFPGMTGPISQGAVTLVGARIATNASQSVPDSTETDFVYQVVDFDTGGFANLGSNARILTAPTSGLYLVSCYTSWAYNNEGLRNGGVFHNGYASGGASSLGNDQRMPVWAPINDAHANNEPHSTTIATELIQAVAGDFFSSGGTQKAGANVLINDPPSGSGFLSAVLIGA